MEKYFYPPKEQWERILVRPSSDSVDRELLCRRIFRQVRTQGDRAVRKFSRIYDRSTVDNLLVDGNEFADADRQVPAELKEAIKVAATNIERFHAAQATGSITCHNGKGVTCWQRPVPIGKIGLYIPGGTAPLFSTVLMLAIPASLARCPDIILCTPPRVDGTIDPAILWTAQFCGVKRIYKVGGIQAIAAMTYGTETIPAVYKIFGPGNGYVTQAKQYAVGQGVAIDMPAGPSEVMVVADQTAHARFIAADLLSQAEHGATSQTIMVTWTPQLVEQVEREILLQLEALGRREITTRALERSRIIVVKDRKEAMELTNLYAPEHLILSAEDPLALAADVVNAGSVFLGNYSPESVGDYASGTNHTLPTGGWARSYSGVDLDSFTRKITFQFITPEGLKRLAPTVMAMADGEGLAAHKNAVAIRLKALEDGME